MKYNETVAVIFKKRWKYLTEPLWIRTQLEDGSNFAFQIPVGFKTDFASIPRFFWFFIAPSDSQILVPAIAHDYLYSRTWIEGYELNNSKLGKKKKIKFNRLMADLLLRGKMRSFKARIIKRNLVFMAVRLCGWMFYHKKNK